MDSKKMFSDAKVGDRVYSIGCGWGVIRKTRGHNEDTPIEVLFDNGATSTFSLDGMEWDNDINPTLFWNEIKFEVPEKPKRKVKKSISCFGNIYREGYAVIGSDGLSIIFATAENIARSNANDKQALAVAVPVKIEFEIEE